MINDIKNMDDFPTLKEIELHLFRELQEVFKNTLLSILEELDDWLKDNRDFKRFKNREKQKTTLATMFGSITINRRKYFDQKAGVRVALLDQFLQYDEEDSLSPFLTEMVIKWAVKGPSYRDARDRFCDLLGYQATSHETIRKEVLRLNQKRVRTQRKNQGMRMFYF